MEHLDYVERLTITKITQASQTSTSAVLRFCKTLGFQGFKDFRYAAINFLRTEIRDTENNQFSHNLQSYQQGLNALQSIPEDHIQDLLSALANANHIFAIGLYQSSLPAKLFHYGLLNLD